MGVILTMKHDRRIVLPQRDQVRLAFVPVVVYVIAILC